MGAGLLSLMLPLLGGALGAFASFFLGEMTARRRLREARADRLMFENLSRRQAAYDSLFKAIRRLEEYVERFLRPDCNGFWEIEDAKGFAPLSAWGDFRKAADE